jgi:hypothetical protein
MKDRQIDMSDIPALEKAFFKRAVLWPSATKPVKLHVNPKPREHRNRASK